MSLIKCLACGRAISAEASACPQCGHPVKKTAEKSAKKGGCLLIVIIFVGWTVYSFNKDNRNVQTFEASNPSTITAIISESSAKPTATFEDGRLLLTYNLDPWMLTASSGKRVFYSNAKLFFKDAFTSPSVQRACVNVTATFHDIKGNNSLGKAADLCMSRSSAEGVNWDNVDSDNIPRIADSSWLHPAFNK